MDYIQIGTMLIGIAGLFLTGMVYLLHKYIMQINERVQLLEKITTGEWVRRQGVKK